MATRDNLMSGIKKLQRKARGERPVFFEDPNIDKLISMIMGLAGEVAVMHDRSDTLERLLQTKGLVKQAEIDNFEPNNEVQGERANWRKNYLSEILRIVESELEGQKAGDTAPYEKAIKTVETS
jgi:hypothetical protein